MREVPTKHDKSKKFQWSELAERGFREMQVPVRNCAKLYSKTILIHSSDASDYGYGAYLCQIVGDREHPVLFMNKSFHGAELNWKTQDKECGAIYKALEKFQYLLYNWHFILETDNKNLTSLNTATSSRVYRWKLAIQRYAFNIRHVVGKLNVVADAFSDVYSTKAYPIQAVATMNEIVLTDEQYNIIGQFHNSATA